MSAGALPSFDRLDREMVLNRRDVCISNACGHWGTHQRGKHEMDGCGLLKKPCRIDQKRMQRWYTGPEGRQCWTATEQRVASVGFLAACFQPVGGTETWHRTLLPSIEGAGFVCFSPALCRGDRKALSCWSGVGITAAKQLADHVDVLVAWGLGSDLGKVLPKHNKPRVISVSHGDGTSDWSGRMMKGQEPWTDRAVYICPSAIQTVPASLRESSLLIPNGVDPGRCQSALSRDEARGRLGIHSDQKVIVSIARLSPEKRIGLMARALEYLPNNFILLVAGSSSGWSQAHGGELQSFASDRFRLLPPVDSPGDLLAAADLYLSCSEYEGFGLSVAEAAVAQVPIVATPVGIVEMEPSIVRAIAISSSPAEVASAIADDFRDLAAQRRRAVHSAQVVGTRFSKESFVRNWAELINSLRTKP